VLQFSTKLKHSGTRMLQTWFYSKI